MTLKLEFKPVAARLFCRRRLAPAWGLALGILAVVMYWPGVVSLIPGFEDYAGLKPLRGLDLRIGDRLHRIAAAPAPRVGPRICVVGVTAEGIETAEQLGWLRELVCDRGQGYYYARPLPADELVRLLAPGAPPIGRPTDGATRVAVRSRPNVRTRRAG